MKTSKTIIQSALLSLLVLQANYSVAQTCNPSIIATTPDADFYQHADGTVTHKTTGLMWKVCSEGLTWESATNTCTGTASTPNWDDALAMPTNINGAAGFAGYTDWRLPNTKELKSIVEYQCYDPAINENIFPNTTHGSGSGGEYWTNTPDPSAYSHDDDDANKDSVLTVRFSDGDDRHAYWRNDNKPVRLVRGGL